MKIEAVNRRTFNFSARNQLNMPRIFEQGKIFFIKGNYAKALECFKVLLKKHSNNVYLQCLHKISEYRAETGETQPLYLSRRASSSFEQEEVKRAERTLLIIEYVRREGRGFLEDAKDRVAYSVQCGEAYRIFNGREEARKASLLPWEDKIPSFANINKKEEIPISSFYQPERKNVPPLSFPLPLEEKKTLNFENIIELVAKIYNVDSKKLIEGEDKESSSLIDARQLAMYLLRRLLRYSSSAIREKICDKQGDINGIINKLEKFRRNDLEFARFFKNIEESFKEIIILPLKEKIPLTSENILKLIADIYKGKPGQNLKVAEDQWVAIYLINKLLGCKIPPILEKLGRKISPAIMQYTEKAVNKIKERRKKDPKFNQFLKDIEESFELPKKEEKTAVPIPSEPKKIKKIPKGYLKLESQDEREINLFFRDLNSKIQSWQAEINIMAKSRITEGDKERCKAILKEMSFYKRNTFKMAEGAGLEVPKEIRIAFRGTIEEIKKLLEESFKL